MPNVVTGLAPNEDTAALRQALTEAGLSPEKLQVISGEDGVRPLGSSLAGEDLLVTDPGTSVPGLTGHAGTLGGSASFFRSEGLTDRLADIRVPDSEIDNYAEALERGKTIVAFFAKPETVAAAEAVFRKAALANVRVF